MSIDWKQAAKKLWRYQEHWYANYNQMWEECSRLTNENAQLRAALEAADKSEGPWLLEAEYRELREENDEIYDRYKEARNALHEANSEIVELRAALEPIEWAGRSHTDEGDWCLVCGNYRRESHAPDCLVGNALKGDE